ncbi:transposase [Yersinia frederiksenii ATCC 33641]|nr:transposase [Yersinia frederiksenii ATCC 33641]
MLLYYTLFLMVFLLIPLFGNAFSRLHYPVDVIAQRVRRWVIRQVPVFG